MSSVTNSRFLFVALCVATLAFSVSCTRTREGRKTSEAHAEINSIYAAASAYYATEHVVDGKTLSHCTVESVADESEHCFSVLGFKRSGLHDPPTYAGWKALGYTPTHGLENAYDIVSHRPGCGHQPGEHLYTVVARGDIDCDGAEMRVQLDIKSDPENRLYLPTAAVVSAPNE